MNICVGGSENCLAATTFLLQSAVRKPFKKQLHILQLKHEDGGRDPICPFHRKMALLGGDGEDRDRGLSLYGHDKSQDEAEAVTETPYCSRLFVI